MWVIHFYLFYLSWTSICSMNIEKKSMQSHAWLRLQPNKNQNHIGSHWLTDDGDDENEKYLTNDKK